MSEPRDHRGGIEDTIGGVVVAALTLGLVVLLLPGVTAGLLIAQVLRWKALRWTWILVAILPAGALLALGGPPAVGHLQEAAEALADDGRIDRSRVLDGLWPWWLPVAVLTGIARKRTLDRRDGLHGGAAGRHLSGEIGPVDFMRRRAAWRRAEGDGAYRDGAVLLGEAERGRPVYVPRLVAHACIVGGSNTGKTNTAEVLLEGAVASGSGFVILDGKGGRELPYAALTLSQRYDRPLALWSVLEYGDPNLDAHRRRWNPAGGGNPTEIKDRIADAEEQSEPYYAAVAARGLLAAAQAQHIRGRPLRLDELAALLDEPQRLANTLKEAGPDRFKADIAWIDALGTAEKSGLRGMGLRLHTMTASDGGEWLLPDPHGQDIDLYRAVTEGWLVVFTLPEGTYPALIPQVCRYLLAALNAVGTRLERAGRRGDSVVFVDELSAFDGDQLCSGLERGRSAGLSYIVATQSLSNFDSAGGDKLLDGILDNSELVIIHRQTVPRAADLLALVAGTEESWTHTHQVSDHARRPFGGPDESGERSRKLTERYRAHPNVIKQLPTGEAVIVVKRPAFDVRQVRIRPGITAIREPSREAESRGAESFR